MKAFEKARPTLRSSGSFTVIRHCAVAASFVAGVGVIGAHHTGAHRREVVPAVRARRPERRLDDGGLLVDVEPSERDSDVVAVAAELVHGNLERGRRWLADDTGDAHAIWCNVVEADGVEPSGDVGTEVERAGDLVEQLGRDGADRHLATGAVVLADDGAAVGGHIGPRESQPLHAGHLGEERVVAAGCLRRALDHVPGHHGAGERVPVVARPAVVPCRRAAREGSIGDAAGDHDVGIAPERLDDAPAPEVRVGREEARHITERPVGRRTA